MSPTSPGIKSPKSSSPTPTMGSIKIDTGADLGKKRDTEPDAVLSPDAPRQMRNLGNRSAVGTPRAGDPSLSINTTKGSMGSTPSSPALTPASPRPDIQDVRNVFKERAMKR